MIIRDFRKILHGGDYNPCESAGKQFRFSELKIPFRIRLRQTEGGVFQ